jgi:hypothetical protein
LIFIPNGPCWLIVAVLVLLGAAAAASVLPAGPAMLGVCRAARALRKIAVDPGFAVDPVHDRPPEQPQDPDRPQYPAAGPALVSGKVADEAAQHQANRVYLGLQDSVNFWQSETSEARSEV